MKIVRPYAKLCNTDLGRALNVIEAAARVSHASEDKQMDNTAERFIKNVVIDHGDWSVVEHVSATVEFKVDRGITHEIVRHRIAAYTQSSTRFINYDKKYQKGHEKEGQVITPAEFIYPKTDVECEHCVAGHDPTTMNGYDKITEGENYQHHFHPRHEFRKVDLEYHVEPCAYDQYWLSAIKASESMYKELIAKGWRPQEARSVFPNALASKLIMTCNLRNWRHFFLMRTSKEAHPQMRQVTIPLLKAFQEAVPLLYDDIIPESRQADNIAKGR